MTICPKCCAPATIELSSGINKPYLQISRLICENGHCEIESKTILDREKSKSRSTMSRLFDRRPVIQTLNGLPLVSGHAD